MAFVVPHVAFGRAQLASVPPDVGAGLLHVPNAGPAVAAAVVARV